MLIIVSQFFPAMALAQDDGTPVAPSYEEQATVVIEPTIEPSPTPLPPEPEPTATAEPPAPSPTTVPEPTETPIPTLGFQLRAQPECLLAPDQPAELASGGAIEYTCASQIEIDGEHIAAAGVVVTWHIGANVTPGWEVSLLPPARTADERPEWTPFLDGKSEFSFDQFDPAGTATEVGTIGTVATLDYRLRIVRPACLVGAPIVELEHNASVNAPAATGIDLGAETIHEPVVIAPVLAAIPEPSVSFDGGLSFGTITATAAGLSETRLEGTLGITITGLDTACGTWNLQLSATPIADEHGDVREGFSLLFGECDLVDGCRALTVVAGPNEPSAVSTTLTFTLQAPLYAALGALGTTLDAALIASSD